MRVLVFTTQFYQLGGAERLAVQLAVDLNRRGVPCDIVSLYRDDLSGVAATAAHLQEQGVPNIYFLGADIRPSVRGVLRCIKALRQLIKRENYHIVETSLLSPTVIAAWAVRGTSARHAAGIHQVFLPDRENTLNHLILRASTGLNRHTRYYAISDYVAAAWTKFAGVPFHKIRRIHNGIAAEYFGAHAEREAVRQELDIPANGRIALYVGRLAPSKGIDQLLNALQPLLASENIYLVYSGAPDFSEPGTAGMLADMREQITSQALSGFVRFIGFRSDTPRLLASADVLVHLTKGEGFGLTVVEALAVGLPVVASNVDALPEILQGSGSTLVNAEDLAAVRAAILDTLGRQPVAAREAARSGKKRANAFRLSKRTAALLRLFEDLSQNRF